MHGAAEDLADAVLTWVDLNCVHNVDKKSPDLKPAAKKKSWQRAREARAHMIHLAKHIKGMS